MPDLTIETRQMCASIAGPASANVGGYHQEGLFDERTWPTCDCPAYKFAKAGYTTFGMRRVPNPCKHIRQAEKEACGWHEDWSEERQVERGVCPRCGGETVSVRVAC